MNDDDGHHRHPVPDWSTLIGHTRVEQWFASAIRQHRLAGSFLFVGPHGIGKRTVANLLAKTLLCGKRTVANLLAKTLLCDTSEPSRMKPCGVCTSCVQVAAGTHPDVVRTGKPDDKTFIPLELLIGPPDARMQEGFCRDVRMKPLKGSRKVAILEDADFLNEEGANSLLKTLEEPPSDAIILLVGTSEQRQLPTIRSRCQIIRLGPLSESDACSLLRTVYGIEADDDVIRGAVEISGGDLSVARRLLDAEADALRQQLTEQLKADAPDPVVLSRTIASHVDAAGKEASKRRGAMRDVFSISVQHFRKQMRDEAFDGRGGRPDTLARLDRSVRAIREVDRSANQSTLIECFAADIAAGTTGDRGEIG